MHESERDLLAEHSKRTIAPALALCVDLQLYAVSFGETPDSRLTLDLSPYQSTIDALDGVPSQALVPIREHIRPIASVARKT